MARIGPVHDLPFPIEETTGITTMESLFRTMGHRPAIAQQSMQLLQTVMRSGTVEPKLKELLAVRVSQVNNCFY